MNTLETIVYPVVDLVKGMPGENADIAKHPDTRLFGADAGLDSVGLLNFITATEEQITAVTGKTISLVTPRALSMKESPFRSLRTLAEFIDEQLSVSG